ncbi:MAG: hypothetical protein Q7T03_05450 [Deltaproteobacteria bacterium]|nr:hypothetical protein [Deltaproteobacteria bacterium]
MKRIICLILVASFFTGVGILRAQIEDGMTVKELGDVEAEVNPQLSVLQSLSGQRLLLKARRGPNTRGPDDDSYHKIYGLDISSQLLREILLPPQSWAVNAAFISEDLVGLVLRKSEGQNGKKTLLLHNFSTGGDVIQDLFEPNVNSPLFSSDGQKIVASTGKRVDLYTYAGGGENWISRKIYELPARQQGSVNVYWDLNGDIVVDTFNTNTHKNCSAVYSVQASRIGVFRCAVTERANSNIEYYLQGSSRPNCFYPDTHQLFSANNTDRGVEIVVQTEKDSQIMATFDVDMQEGFAGNESLFCKRDKKEGILMYGGGYGDFFIWKIDLENGQKVLVKQSPRDLFLRHQPVETSVAFAKDRTIWNMMEQDSTNHDVHSIKVVSTDGKELTLVSNKKMASIAYSDTVGWGDFEESKQVQALRNENAIIWAEEVTPPPISFFENLFLNTAHAEEAENLTTYKVMMATFSESSASVSSDAEGSTAVDTEGSATVTTQPAPNPAPVQSPAEENSTGGGCSLILPKR